MCFLFDIDSISSQYFYIWLIDDDRWSFLLFICIFRAFIVNWFIFYCTSLHWRLYLLNLLIDFIEYSMLLHLVLWTFDNFSMSLGLELLKVIHDANDRDDDLRIIPCEMILKQ